MRKFLFYVCFIVVSMTSLYAQRGFAIVIDPKSYQEAKWEVEQYATSIETLQGLKVYTIIDKWGVPDSIRAELIRLHMQKNYPIEGAVFIGDIPITMIRDAQHLTSAFKMDQRRDRKRSSVPSDRFYDDFGLKFTYLEKDEDAPYFYYSLSAESAQYLSPDIYTGRIRPTDSNGVSRYDKLRNYLKKVVAEKQNNNLLDHIFFFGGHGYISESMVARMDEKEGLYEHFPWLKQQKNGISFMDHSQEDVIKFRLMNELMRPELDYAILHHHGAWDTQYLNNIPKPKNASQAKEMIQKYGRTKIRSAKERGKNVDSVMVKLKRQFDIPSTWLENTFAEEICRNDSVEDANLDLHLSDFITYNYTPNCRVVMIDACFCGSFHKEDCIANEYIFSSGQNIVCIANTVNVLQDKWSDRFTGLFGLGMCVGDVVRFSGYLESHIIGDPTFAFAPAVEGLNINQLLATNDASGWRKWIHRSDFPELQCMAIEQLNSESLITSAELLDIFRTSSKGIVRLQALVSLSKHRDTNFIEAIKLAVDDSYEMVQRLGLRFLGQNGDERLIPSLIKIIISNNTSERSKFNAKNAISLYPEDKLLKEFDKQFNSDDICYINKEEVGHSIEKMIKSTSNKWVDETMSIVADDTSDKERKSNIRNLRNYCPHYLVPSLLSYLKVSNKPEIQVFLLEALGWQKYSYMVPQIRTCAKEMSENMDLPQAVRNEALKTYNRLK
ncbi:HEAT repeat domain-containing protein [Porphyromonadaceae bacterium W3.11]|nr:HEAT repeat domain-containing protein [Porphyromonadaceae bacterium W3.11]